MRLTWVALLAVVTLASACTSAVNGHGLGAPAPSTSRSAAPTAAPDPSSATPGESIFRKPATDSLGDPVTTDYCSGIDLSGFRRYGLPGFHEYQLADACFIDVEPTASQDLLVDIISYPDTIVGDNDEPQETLQYATSVKQLGGGYSEGTWDDDGTVCERVFGTPDIAITITEEDLRGTSTASQRCGVANEALKQVAALYRHRLPTRSLAQPSVTRFDLCNVLDLGGATDYRDFRGAFPAVDLGGAECDLDGGDLLLDVRYAFIESHDAGLPVVTIDGHRLEQKGDNKACEVVSVQGRSSDGQTSEILDLGVVVQSGTYLSATLCKVADDVMIEVLRKTGLK